MGADPATWWVSAIDSVMRIRHLVPGTLCMAWLAACRPSGSTNVHADSAPSLQAWTASLPDVATRPLDAPQASRFAALSLACAEKEYPNKPDHIVTGDTELRPPRENTPAFFGCFDWHSAVHGHWALARVLKLYPQLPEAAQIRSILSRHLTADRMHQELAFFQRESNAIYERPYGWGWLLRLAAELHRMPDASAWDQAVTPLAAHLARRFIDYLQKLTVPVRAGTHANTAFSLVHALDYARVVGDTALAATIEQRARDFYAQDKQCPTAYEPSGEDFISPCLAEMDLMRRVLSPEAFVTWLTDFLPPLPSSAFAPLSRPTEVKDLKDPRIGHLIGLALQRAWCFEGAAAILPPSDGRREAFLRIARLHTQRAEEQMFDSGYGGAHWLASFAIYLLTSSPSMR